MNETQTNKSKNPFWDYPLYTFVKYDEVHGFGRYYYKSPGAKGHLDWDFSFPAQRLQQNLNLGLPKPT